VHSHAAGRAALINYCEGVERDTLVLYLDLIIACSSTSQPPTVKNAKQSKCYVQEQAIATLAMVADASKATFVKVDFELVYPFISPFIIEHIAFTSTMPLLLNVLRNAADYKK
jgi:hypothetical protein